MALTPRTRWPAKVGDWNVIWLAKDEAGELRRYARSAKDLSDMTKLLEEAFEFGAESMQFKKVWEK
jgi:hypothetical protein